MIKNIIQFAVVTPNCDDTISVMRKALNLGPMKVWDFRHPAIFDTTINELPAHWSMKLAFGWMGEMQFEIIQPTGGASLYQEYLNRFKQAGVQHLLIDRAQVSYLKMKQFFSKAGMPIANEAKTNVAVKIGPFTLPPLPMFLARSMSTVFGYTATIDTLKTVIETSKYPPGVRPRTGIRMGVPTYSSPGKQTEFEQLPANSLITGIEGFVVLVKDINAVKPHYIRLFGAPKSHQNHELVYRLETIFLKIVQPENGSAYAKILEERGEGIQILQVTPRDKIKNSNNNLFEQNGFKLHELSDDLSLFTHPEMPFQIQVNL